MDRCPASFSFLFVLLLLSVNKYIIKYAHPQQIGFTAGSANQALATGTRCPITTGLIPSTLKAPPTGNPECTADTNVSVTF